MYRLRRLRNGAAITLLAIALFVSNMGTMLAAVPENETIAAVSISDNSTVVEGTILAVIQTKAGDKVNAESIKKDMQAIFDLGYFIDVVVNFSTLENGVKITYQVVENPVVNEIVVKGNAAVPSAKIIEMLQNIQGNVLNSKTLGQAVQEIARYYHDQGYILAKITDVSMNAQGRLTITINEGKLEGIEVKGNKITKDYVITREMNVKVGQPFNVKDARRSMQKVYNLGYFEDVNMKLNPGTELNSVVLRVEVKEQKMNIFDLGGGYSSADGMVGFIDLGMPNLHGTGDQVKIHWEFGGDTGANNYNLGFTRPWLDKKKTSIAFNIYDMTKEKDEYNNHDVRTSTFDENRKGWNVTIGRPHGEYRKNYITYKDETVDWENITSGTPEGKEGTTHSITLQSVLDTRDNVFNATEGHRIALTTQFAGGMLGGNFDFRKYQIEGRKYVKVDNQHVWAFRLGAGFAEGNDGDDVPSSERFEVGGTNSLRGYEEDRYKGNRMVTASAEYRFPLGSKVQGAGFVDAGYASDYSIKLNDIKTSVGVGVRVTTPIGPLRLDYGVGEKGGKFHFSMGGSF